MVFFLGTGMNAMRSKYYGPTPDSGGVPHRNPGLDAREKLTRVVTESEMAKPIAHRRMMSPDLAGVNFVAGRRWRRFGMVTSCTVAPGVDRLH
jgi:hypothetical protein